MFYFDENVMNDVLSLLNKNISQVESMEDGYLNKMSSISNSGLYGNGIEVIDSQITSIKDGYNNFKDITSNNCNKVVSLEKQLVKEAGEISLPKDFDADDTGYIVSVKGVSLSKDDGRSVNEGNLDDQAELTDYYENEVNKEIAKLKNAELSEEELDDYEKSEKTSLDEMDSQETFEQKMEDYKETEHDTLKKVKTDNDVDSNIEIDDEYSSLDEVSLDDITDK